MGVRGEYADILRVIGHLLDEHEAEQVEIIQYEGFMAISWQLPGGAADQRAYNDIDLKLLRDKARRLRGAGPATGEKAELLRTLGQELDAHGIEANGIVEDEDGYRVSGVADRRYVNVHYSFFSLRKLSAAHRAERPPEESAVQPTSASSGRARTGDLKPVSILIERLSRLVRS
jgi:hypothetical protein